MIDRDHPEVDHPRQGRPFDITQKDRGASFCLEPDGSLYVAIGVYDTDDHVAVVIGAKTVAELRKALEAE